LITSFYGCSGQRCLSGAILAPVGDVADELLAKFMAAAKAVTLGEGLNEKTGMGPVVSAAHKQRVLGYIEKGIAEGAKLVLDGRDCKVKDYPNGFFVGPTIFDHVRPEMTIAREEIFGPVVSIMAFDTPEEAVRLANDTRFGLTAGVWTRDVKLAHRMARAIRAGTVWVNMFNVVTSEAPFGGFKESGWGRENGPHAIDAFTEVKHVYVNLAERSTDWFGDEG